MADELQKTVDEIVLDKPAETPVTDAKPEKARDEAGRFKREEAEDAALSASLAKHGITKAAEKPAEKEQPAAEAGESKGKSTGTKVPKALELDGFTSEDLQGMSEERIAALEQKAQKRQSDIGKKLSERSKSETAATAKTETPKAQEAQAYKDLVKGVGELLGDDVGEALSGVLEKAMSPLVERLNRAEGLLQQRLEAEMGTQVESLRGKLAEDFPPLKDDAVLKRVVERMGAIADPEKHSDMEAVMRDACRYELFDDMVKAAAAKTTRNDTSRNNGQATAPNRSAKPSATKTREQLDDEALDAALKKNGLIR